MLIAVIVFFVVAAIVGWGSNTAIRLPAILADRRMARRLRDVSLRGEPVDTSSPTSLVREQRSGPVPALDRLLGGREASLTKLIEQSGVATTPSTVVLMSLALGMGLAVSALALLRQPLVAPVLFLFGCFVPTAYLRYRRTARLRRFEEQFPEALDLLSRAIRAGHAFQTAMGMCAEELPAPVGVEFKKSFDQQNYGLPLKETLNELAERVPILDVKFFVTAVTIQRETGGNLSEILDNLAHVVRERFKILRQVRVHTAHGRFTGYVLLALPAALAVVLSFMNPEHMDLLFKERLGQMMILGAICMQTIGYVWIRQVIKIEV